MQLTPKELQGVATSRYWKENKKSIRIGFLIVANIIALCLLGLYFVGYFPPEIPPTEYSLNGTVVAIDNGKAYLNGEEMQREEGNNNLLGEFLAIGLLPVVLLAGYVMYHENKAKKFGRDLLEESITKEKANG